jgi:hypothetical protein
VPAPLPMAPRPYAKEAISSWVKRVAARYDIAAHHLVSHLLHGHQVSVGRTERLDHCADAALEVALGKASGSTSRGSKAYASPAMTAAPYAGTGCARPGVPLASAATSRTWERFMNVPPGGWAVVCPAHTMGAGKSIRRSAGTVGWMTKAPEYSVFGSPPVSPGGSGVSKAMRSPHLAGRFPIDREVSCRRPVA